MPFVLRFELDTIDAFNKAKTRKKKIISVGIRILPFFLHAFCAVMEYVAYAILNNKASNEIVCMKYFEISDAGNVFMILNYYCLQPDLMFAILGPISIFMIYHNPYTVFFNGCCGIINIVNGILYHVFAYPCGHPDLGYVFLAPILCYLCGILHITLAVLAHMTFTYWDKEGEAYFGRIVDMIEEMRGKKK